MKVHKKSAGMNQAGCAVKRSFRGQKVKAAPALVASPKGSDADVRRLSRAYNLSNEALSRVTGASPRTVSYWNAGAAPQRSSAQKLREVTRLFDALSDIIKAKAIGPWLQRPNDAFDGSTPLQVMERGENDRLWRMIWQIREGNTG
jgi:DNA-binding transcriptional regulator YiaG